VKSAWSGLRPLAVDPGAADSASALRDHVVAVSPGGLVTVAGGKWTTYRLMAEDAIDKAVQVGGLEAKARPCATAHLPLVGAAGWSPALFTEVAQGYRVPHRAGAIDTRVAKHLAGAYGGRAREVTALAEAAGLGRRLARGYPVIEVRGGACAWAAVGMGCMVYTITSYYLILSPFVHRSLSPVAPRTQTSTSTTHPPPARPPARPPNTQAEVLYCMRAEFCEAPEDFLARRCRLAFLDRAAALEALPRVVELMAAERGWGRRRAAAEAHRARAFLDSFEAPGGAPAPAPAPAPPAPRPEAAKAGERAPAAGAVDPPAKAAAA
jgi:glycerol-3-phosphate dehydrogenase